MDGVLVDSYEVWYEVVRDACEEYGLPAVSRERFRDTWGQGVAADRDAFFGDRQEDEIARYYAAHFMDHVSRLQVNPRGGDVMAALEGGGSRTAVVTNTPGDLARRILEAAGLGGRIVVGADEVPRAKPAPDILYRACELLGIEPGESVVVGDSCYDREAARAAGAPFIGYRTGDDGAIESLDELLSLVVVE